MLRRVHDLLSLAVQATDGLIGHVKDLYFDDETWIVRYLVVESGTWLSSRKVLVSPMLIGHPDWPASILPVSITKEQVRHSPDFDTDKPVSRQYEMRHLGYYGLPNYWEGTDLRGGGQYQGALLPGVCVNPTSAERFETQSDRGRLEVERLRLEMERERAQIDDPHLRSCNAVIGYQIHAIDGDIGHVKDLQVEDVTWAIRYIIGNTSNWWFGHQVLIAPQWVLAVSWPDRRVTVDLVRRALQDAPPYDPSVPLDRSQELRIFKHYGRATYWNEPMQR